MTRGEFITSVIGFLGLSILPKSVPVTHYQRIYLLQDFIRGFQYYEGKNYLDNFYISQLLELKRENTNTFDSFAIAIYHGSLKIGYLPRENNEIIAKIIDADLLDFSVEIVDINKEALSWENIFVAVYVLKPQNQTLSNNAQYLTQKIKPHYQSILINKETEVRVFRHSVLPDEDGIYPDRIFNTIQEVAQRQGMRDFDHSFPNRHEFTSAIKEGRIIINKNALPVDLSSDVILRPWGDIELDLSHITSRKGDIVANISRIEKLSERVKNIAIYKDLAGRSFFEFKLT